jgi:hypothetical protein
VYNGPRFRNQEGIPARFKSPLEKFVPSNANQFVGEPLFT